MSVVAPTMVTADRVDARVFAAAILRQTLVTIDTVVVVPRTELEAFETRTRVISVRIRAEVNTAAVLVFTFVIIDANLSVSVESVLALAPERLGRVVALCVLVALILTRLTPVDVVGEQRDDGPTQTGSRPEVARDYPVQPDV